MELPKCPLLVFSFLFFSIVDPRSSDHLALVQVEVTTPRAWSRQREYETWLFAAWFVHNWTKCDKILWRKIVDFLALPLIARLALLLTCETNKTGSEPGHGDGHVGIPINHVFEMPYSARPLRTTKDNITSISGSVRGINSVRRSSQNCPSWSPV